MGSPDWAALGGQRVATTGQPRFLAARALATMRQPRSGFLHEPLPNCRKLVVVSLKATVV